jgi:hypothetical protein
MQVALLATLLLVAVWFVALRPKSPNGGPAAPAPAAQTAPAAAAANGAAPGVSGLKRAIDNAHGAVATASGDAQRAAQSSADGSQPPAPPSAPAGQAPAAAPAQAPVVAAHVPSASGRSTRGAGGGRRARHHAAHGAVAIAAAALKAHLALALAFVDNGTADARAVAQEMRHVSTFGGRAVVLTAPLSRLSDFDFITNTVQVTVAPTVVIVDRRSRATTIVGFADRGEIEQRLADAVAVKPAR